MIKVEAVIDDEETIPILSKFITSKKGLSIKRQLVEQNAWVAKHFLFQLPLFIIVRSQ